jgi:hypothetical protein
MIMVGFLVLAGGMALGLLTLVNLGSPSKAADAIESHRQRALVESWHEVNVHRRLAEWNRGEFPTGWRAEYRPAAPVRDADDHDGRMGPAPRPVRRRD